MQPKFIIEVRAKGFKSLQTNVEKSSKSLKTFGDVALEQRRKTAGLERVVGAIRNRFLLLAFATGAATKGIGGVVRASSQFESVKSRLVGLTGSVEKAEIAFNKFNQVAATTPFTLDDVVNAGAQLEAFGADSQALLKEITDLAAFMGTSATEAANAFGRAFAGGAGAADILRERGILNIVKDSQKLQDLSKTTLPEFREALIKSLQDPAIGIQGSTDRLSETFEGAFSNMKDAVTLLAVEIGDTLMPSMKRATGSITTLAKAATHFLKDLKGEFDSPLFKQNLEGLFEFPLLKFEQRVNDFSVEQLEEELKKLEKSFASTAPTALKKTQTAFENTTESSEKMTTTLSLILPGQDDISDGMITLGEAAGVTNEELAKQALNLAKVNLGVNKFVEAQNKATEENLLSMEVSEESREFLFAQIELLKQLIELRKKDTNEVKTGGETAKTTLEDEAKVFKQFSDQLSRAVVDGQRFGDAVVNSLKAIGAELAAQAVSFGLLSIFSSIMGKGGLNPAGLGFNLLGTIGGSLFPGLFKDKKHDGGMIQSFASGGAVQGRDNVPILAQAGEFVVQRDSAQSIGLNALNQMNETGQAASNINVHIHGGIVDEGYVRNTLLPALSTEGVSIA